MAQMRQTYETETVPALQEKFEYVNRMQLPKIEKIVLNMGLGEAINDNKIMEEAVKELETISGQKPIITRAKKSIAAFKLREGMPVGCTVTLRQERMYDFYSKLVNIALPRVRDFRGVSPKGFDGRGNYTLGIKEQIIFPEIDYDKVNRVKGLNVTIVTSAKTDEEGFALLKLMGMPFRN